MSKSKPGNPARRLALPALGCSLAALAACSPYPDQGEFLASVVYGANFLSGVKTLKQLPALGHGRPAAGGVAPYVVFTTTGSSNKPIGPMAAASSPLWSDSDVSVAQDGTLTYKKRDPLSTSSAQPVYVFDGRCQAPEGYVYDDVLDIIRRDRQYPIFSDIPENLAMFGGRGGRTGAYSAIVEVHHVTLPDGFACQSLKRFDTVTARLAVDLKEAPAVGREYRLLQVFDPALTKPPIPYQLGFYNQLLVPYLDMGPVPLAAGGQRFATMPLVSLVGAMGMPVKGPAALVAGAGDEAMLALPYSPICQDATLSVPMGQPTPLDLTPDVVAGLKFAATLETCLVCRTRGSALALDCPFAQSGAQNNAPAGTGGP